MNAHPQDPQASPKDHTAKVGTVVDKRYRITGLVGRGGMGSVYRAEHVRIRRPVAVKLLHPEFGAIAEVAKRFEREAFATGRLDHPNVVTVSDFGELADGTLFLVMELLNGVSLGDVLADERRLAPSRALHIMRHMLRGLGHAHSADVIHRDVKPENVVLVEHAGDAEFAKLLDFGIAKLVGEAEADEGGEKLTQAGIAFGTPAYISPEQATGSAIDHRADIYSASVVLFEMLTGRAPFESDEKLKLLAMHATREAPRLADIVEDLPHGALLQALVARGLQKSPAHRYEDTGAYISAIDECLIAIARAEVEHTAHAAPRSRSDGGGDLGGQSEYDEATTSKRNPLPATAARPLLGGHQVTATQIGAGGHRRKPWLYVGLGSAAFALLVIIIASAARGGNATDVAERSEAQRQLLRQGDTCKQRKKAAAALGKLGDPRAIPALKKAIARNGNACLVKAAKQAVEQLSPPAKPSEQR